jgi:hypothetical protein
MLEEWPKNEFRKLPRNTSTASETRTNNPDITTHCTTDEPVRTSTSARPTSQKIPFAKTSPTVNDPDDPPIALRWPLALLLWDVDYISLNQDPAQLPTAYYCLPPWTGHLPIAACTHKTSCFRAEHAATIISEGTSHGVAIYALFCFTAPNFFIGIWINMRNVGISICFVALAKLFNWNEPIHQHNPSIRHNTINIRGMRCPSYTRPLNIIANTIPGWTTHLTVLLWVITFAVPVIFYAIGKEEVIAIEVLFNFWA